MKIQLKLKLKNGKLTENQQKFLKLFGKDHALEHVKTEKNKKYIEIYKNI